MHNDRGVLFFGTLIFAFLICAATCVNISAQGNCNSLDVQCPINEGTKAVNANPRDPLAYLQRGYAYLDLADLLRDFSDAGDAPRFKEACANAIKDFDKAIELKADLFDAYWGRAGIYHMMSDLTTAIRDYSKAIELRPDKIGIYENRGFAYAANKNFDLAAKDFTKVIELKPDAKDVYLTYFDRGRAYFDGGLYDKAIADMDKAIALDAATSSPGFVRAYSVRGNAYFKKANYQAALKDFTKVVDSQEKTAMAYSEYPKAYRDRALVYDKLGDKEKAAADRRTADELAKKYPN